jgi:anti-sigma regulatory factor (Ser/Thr protein kinase)
VKELSLHILDIAENSISAGATRIEINVLERKAVDRLRIEVRDNGRGMDAGLAAAVSSPFVTTRTTRKVGLGIPLIKAAAETCNGNFTLESTPSIGTTITVEFQHSHIDRMPMGDLSGTWLTLLVSHPDITWVFEHRTDEGTFRLDSDELTSILDGLSISEPAVLSFLRVYLEDGIKANTSN